MVLIYSTFQSSRLDFVLQFIFEEVYNLEWELCLDDENFNEYRGAKINYSDRPLGTSLQVIPYGLLNENGIESFEPEVFKWNGLPVFFKTIEENEIPFDLFSLVFYLLSRYEEYLPGVKYDMHGRYFAQQSLAFRYSFLEIPLVDILLLHFQRILSGHYKNLKFTSKQYKYTPTFDIDEIFAHKAKPYWRLLGGSFKDLFAANFNKIKSRINVFFKNMNDPYDSFDRMLNEVKESRPLAFINIGDYGTFDKNNDLTHPEVRNKLGDLNQKFEISWHPSYQSNDNKKSLHKEVKRFVKLFGNEPKKSRQHFIRLSFPFTYQDLIEAGVSDDYSMGYHSHIGFRAGTAFTFDFYDLSKEKKTNLRIHPFMFMDGTIFNYMKWDKEKALKRLKMMSDLMKKTGGEMIGIWHNSYIGGNETRFDFFKNVNNLL